MVLAEITTLISLLKGIRSTYEWGSEVLSIEWKNECRKYVDYLEEVKQAVTPYENSNKGGLKLLEGELREACSLLDQWMKKTGPHKQLTSAAFLEKVQTSRANIAQNLQLFWFQLLGTEQATQHTDKAAKHTARQPYHGNRSPIGGGKVRPPDHEGNHAVPQTRTTGGERNHGKPQLRKRSESELKEDEKSRYRLWLAYDVKKWTDSWDTFKNLEVPATSRLDLAEKETLFGEERNKIREKCLRDYRWALTRNINWNSSECLTSWSDAEGYLKHHSIFYLVPETVRKEEWRKHVDKMLERVDKTLEEREARGADTIIVLEQVDKILKAREARGENNRCVSEQVDKMLKALPVLQEKEKRERPLRPVRVGKQKKWFCNVKWLLSVYNND